MLASVLALALLQGAVPTAHSGPTAPRHITLRLVNGKSGLPVWWLGSPHVSVGSNKVPIRRRTNLLGEETIDVTAADQPTISVWVDFIDKDCRSKDFSRVPNTYSLTDILKTGVVSPNYCGSSKTQPKPGVLVIYVTPATFRELWDE